MSSIIQLLPDHVANQIAAGEVVQRPASVVKELLENAVDAKATDIKLIIKDAGKSLIQVVDNGIGMSITDSRLCFERHATSKIRQAEDLFSLYTKGFRGEALTAVSLKRAPKRCSSRSRAAIGWKSPCRVLPVGQSVPPIRPPARVATMGSAAKGESLLNQSPGARACANHFVRLWRLSSRQD